MKICALLIIIAVLISARAPSSADPIVPEPVPDASWIRACSKQRRELTTPNADLCFVGDSLTEFWTSTGLPVWELEFHDRVCVNLGIAGDRTEHILHRLLRFDFSKSKPKTFVVMAGTNNLAKDKPDSPDSVAAGVTRIVDTLKKKSPDSRIFLLSILPNGYETDSRLRADIKQTNKILSAKYLANTDPKVTWLPVHDNFITPDGKWKPGLSIDGTHLSLNGYDVLARTLGSRLAP